MHLDDACILGHSSETSIQLFVYFVKIYLDKVHNMRYNRMRIFHGRNMI